MSLPSLELHGRDDIFELHGGHEYARNHQVLQSLSFLVLAHHLEHLPRVGEFLQGIRGVDTLEARFHLDPDPFMPGATTSNVIRNLAALLSSLARSSCRSLTLKEEFLPHWLPRSVGSSESQASQALPPVNTLKNLWIGLPVVFTPLFRQWIMDSMNSSPLGTLTIDSVGIGSQSWKEVSSGLCLPRLTKLVLSVPEFDFRDLLSFLSRHHALEDLTLLDSPAKLGGNASGLALPKLRTLSCPPRTLVAILGSFTVLPELRAIAIRPEERQSTVRLKDWTYALSVIGSRHFSDGISIALILGTADCPFPADGEAGAVGALEQVEDITIDVRHSLHIKRNVPDYLRTWLSPSTLPNCGLVIIQSQRKKTPSQLYRYIMRTFPAPDVDVMEE